MKNYDSYKVKLVAFERCHVPKTVEWVNDAEMIKLIDRSSEPVTIEGCYKWCDNILEDKTKKMFAITTGDSGVHIGNCGLFEIDNRSRKAKLWIYIGDKEMWHKGLGREALEQLIAYGFENLDLNKIYLYVVEDNERAQKLYKSAGFSKEGVFRKDTFLEGRFKDAVYYGLLKNEFNKRKNHDQAK
ncbi:MAG: GNAT family N-acetyltransferase [Candidatus Omnitrophota bacterium]